MWHVTKTRGSCSRLFELATRHFNPSGFCQILFRFAGGARARGSREASSIQLCAIIFAFDSSSEDQDIAEAEAQEAPGALDTFDGSSDDEGTAKADDSASEGTAEAEAEHNSECCDTGDVAGQ